MICCNGKNIKTVSFESEFDMPALRLGEKSKGVNLILISLAFALAFLVKMPITEYLNCGLTGCQVQKNLKSPKLAKWQIQKRPYQYPKIFKRYDIALFDLVKISIFSGGNQHSLSMNEKVLSCNSIKMSFKSGKMSFDSNKNLLLELVRF